MLEMWERGFQAIGGFSSHNIYSIDENGTIDWTPDNEDVDCGEVEQYTMHCFGCLAYFEVEVNEEVVVVGEEIIE